MHSPVPISKDKRQDGAGESGGYLNSTSHGRKLELPKLQQIRLSIASVTGADGYALEILARLADACRQLARERQPASFDESQALVYGLGDVSTLRGWMAGLGLVAEAVR